MSPTSSQMQKVEPSRIVSCGNTLRVLGSCSGNPYRTALGQGFDDELVDVDVEWPSEGEDDAFGDVFWTEGVDAFVRRLRLLLVAAETDSREVRLDEAGIDRRQPDRPAEQVLAERVREAAHGELRGDVDGGVLVGLAAGDRAHVDDVPAVADVRQAETRHPDQALDVRLQHGLLIFFGRLPKGVAPEAEAGVVDEDVKPAELADRGLDEPLAAFLVSNVELELDLRFELVDAAGAAGDASAFARERGRRRGADAARGARDDCCLSSEARHNRRRLACCCQQGFAATKVQLRPLRREERLSLRELGVCLRTATRGGEGLGRMQTCDRLGSLRTDSLVDGRSGREVALRYCNACLEPRRRRHELSLLQVLLLAANVEHEPGQVLDEPLVELGREREELVDELLGLAALAVEQKRPGMDFQPGMQQLRVPDRARELEATSGVGERGAHVALSHEGAARHHQDWADEVVVYVSHLRQELARRAQALLPGARHLEQHDLFALEPSHRSGLRRQPEAVLALPIELQLA